MTAHTLVFYADGVTDDAAELRSWPQAMPVRAGDPRLQLLDPVPDEGDP